jgi:hypothetical protein
MPAFFHCLKHTSKSSGRGDDLEVVFVVAQIFGAGFDRKISNSSSSDFALLSTTM